MENGELSILNSQLSILNSQFSIHLKRIFINKLKRTRDMAIPLFVKVRPCVAKKLKLDGVRFRTADGNYLLRQSDLMVFGPLYRLPEYAAKIGGVVLRDAEAAANQRGDVNTPLPQPEDPEYADPGEGAPEADAEETPDGTAESEETAAEDMTGAEGESEAEEQDTETDTEAGEGEEDE